jgi:MraZ protein
VVFRGSQQARIDDKGRLKIPSDFRSVLEDRYGTRLFVTSYFGESVLVYPLPVWEEVERKLLALPSTLEERDRLLEAVNYYGAPTELDAQGRVLIPHKLRESALMVGDVDVMGKLTVLEVWNHERLRARVEGKPLTKADLAVLAAAGI